MPTFIEVGELRARADDPEIRIVDARSLPYGTPAPATGDGRELYAAGHIPGAVYLDYATDLADPATPYAARVAPPERFAQVVGACEIGDSTTVVAYDDGDVPYAARVLWMFRYYGHDNVVVLAGGLKAWRDAGFALSTEVPTHAPAIFTPRVRPEMRATRDEVLAIAERRSESQLVETQRDASYAKRERDIPGAVRISGNDLLEDAKGGRVAPRETLNALVDDAKLDRSKHTVVTCGSGVSASGSYLALLEAGFTDLAVYDGSWAEWEHDGLPTVPKKT